MMTNVKNHSTFNINHDILSVEVFMFEKILTSLMIFSFLSCATYTDDVLTDDVPELIPVDVSDPWPSCFYPVRYSSTEVYLDQVHRPYEITVEADSRGYSSVLTAYEVGQLAAYIVEVHKEMELPNNDQVYEMLSRGHFVVIGDDEVFTQLRQTEDAGNISAFIWVDTSLACWESPEGVNWTSATRDWTWDRRRVSVVVHEMIHAVALKTYGSSNGQHDFETLWKTFGENTLQARVIKKHDCDYFPANCITDYM